MDIKKKLKGRKFWLVFAIFMVATLLLAVPPWFGKVIIDATHYVSLISIIVSAYFGANVWQKKSAVNGNENGEH